MNILIFEYITGGGMIDQTLPPALIREGHMMLNAVVSDLQALPNINVSALRDYRLSAKKVSTNDIVIKSEGSYVESINNIAPQLDALLIIAPETNDILSELCERFSNQTFILLNSTLESIVLTSSKYDTYKYLQTYDIPQIPTYLPNEIDHIKANQFVMKPIDGVGCDGLSVLHSRIGLIEAVTQYKEQQYIIQPFVKGIHASLSLICWEGECLFLSCNEQCLNEKNGGFELTKCNVNAFTGQKYRSFSQKIVQALPCLRGYVGVDILITEKEILLVEINSRLTTSYAGLRNALGINPAELILHCFIHQRLPKIETTKNNMITVQVEADCAA